MLWFLHSMLSVNAWAMKWESLPCVKACLVWSSEAQTHQASDNTDLDQYLFMHTQYLRLARILHSNQKQVEMQAGWYSTVPIRH